LPGPGEEAFYAAIEQRLFRAALEQQMWNPELDISGPEPELAILASALEAEGRPLRFEFAGLNRHNTGHRVIALVSHDECSPTPARFTIRCKRLTPE